MPSDKINWLAAMFAKCAASPSNGRPELGRALRWALPAPGTHRHRFIAISLRPDKGKAQSSLRAPAASIKSAQLGSNWLIFQFRPLIRSAGPTRPPLGNPTKGS